MKHLTLSQIWIYPVKSLGGIALPSAKVMEKGLEFDRRWMLVDDSGVFLTQRNHPEMALFKTALDGNELIVTREKPAGSRNRIALTIGAPPTGKQFHARIWKDEVAVVEADRAVSEWFSAQLGFGCRLVHFPEASARKVDERYRINDEHVSLADAYPFMMIGQRSLDDLNSRLSPALPMNRFRPNFVFTGGDAFEEDGWKDLTIGTNRFVNVKPCARCALPNVNQDTAEKGAEPLATLTKYRKKDNNVLFGVNLLALDHGVVSVGDTITVQSR